MQNCKMLMPLQTRLLQRSGSTRYALFAVTSPIAPASAIWLTALIELQRAVDRSGNRGTRFWASVLQGAACGSKYHRENPASARMRRARCSLANENGPGSFGAKSRSVGSTARRCPLVDRLRASVRARARSCRGYDASPDPDRPRVHRPSDRPWRLGSPGDRCR
jgi:hypothetical protein